MLFERRDSLKRKIMALILCAKHFMSLLARYLTHLHLFPKGRLFYT